MTLQTFKGLPHRIELVAEIDGVAYYNDSKATNVVSMEKALASFSSPLVVIAGGKDKEGDFSPLLPLVQERVKAMVLIGQASDKLEKVFSGHTRILRAKDLKEAVKVSRREARPGDVVLLSPGCASFDQFKNFEERGDVFREQVLKMKEEK
jgi:UDP-N-acetylmuramoylalanine--D-glutamate ligase